MYMSSFSRVWIFSQERPAVSHLGGKTGGRSVPFALRALCQNYLKKKETERTTRPSAQCRQSGCSWAALARSEPRGPSLWVERTDGRRHRRNTQHLV